MENNNQTPNPNTGAKGVFPGINQELNFGAGAILPNNGEINTVSVGDSSRLNESTSLTTPANTKTYFRMETQNIEGQVFGILEIDLISFREKGEESRYVKIFSLGVAEDGNPSETNLSIDNEADFNKFKKFISELNWND